MHELIPLIYVFVFGNANLWRTRDLSLAWLVNGEVVDY
jgi:hypothetical protein